jgi:2-polyprenyl-6-methoxyphenol hydroxylase-like FAD-dependent oxidoreductase
LTGETLKVQCCIAGGGPAGMMLGLLLVRAGVDVIVLEKHSDFLRDFRGDTIHPSTLEVLHELGLLEEFLKLPHQKAHELGAYIGDRAIPFADFTHLPTRCKFIAFIPQWDFLNFLAQQATHYPHFDLRMSTEATDLIEDSGRVVGVRAQTPSGRLEIRADLVVAADGRASILREKAGLQVQDLGAPMDVLWFRLSRRPDDPEQTMGRFAAQQIFIMISRSEYWQCGYVIPKGAIEQIRARGLEAFRTAITAIASFVGDRVTELRDWDDVSVLSVRVDRLRRWYRPGLLCIGDAAHAMSPVGGVGINLAIQDAVAAANALSQALRTKQLAIDHLRRVQRRRELPTRVTQRFQVVIQNRIISRVLKRGGELKPPFFLRMLRMLARFPVLRRVPARLIGIGIRPEHVAIPAFNTGTQ